MAADISGPFSEWKDQVYSNDYMLVGDGLVLPIGATSPRGLLETPRNFEDVNSEFFRCFPSKASNQQDQAPVRERHFTVLSSEEMVAIPTNQVNNETTAAESQVANPVHSCASLAWKLVSHPIVGLLVGGYITLAILYSSVA